MLSRVVRELEDANKELWLFLMMFGILAMLNYMIASDRMMLGFYTLPTVFSAYFFGRRHATLTALGSILLVILILHWNPLLFREEGPTKLIIAEKWYDLAIWGGTLIVTAYAMGTLYERKEERIRELRATYHGVLLILQQFISRDEYTEHHSYRVAIYATRIAAIMGLDSERIEDVRAASLLHDIGKMELSRELLHRAARLTESERHEMSQHVEKGAHVISGLGGSLHRIIPIVLAHHDKFDGSVQHSAGADGIPLEARIISVADVYDALISDRPYRKAMSPLDAKEIILKGSGTDFDPGVVKAFLKAFQKGELELDYAGLEALQPTRAV
jgi:putative nucleotidyltransferase with HDIG domain